MNYKELEFKCGLEVHQQLETHKLFCKCPSIVNDANDPDIIVKRKIRTTSGESGKVDKAAKFEHEKDKTFIYEACSSSSCLVELDDDPPSEVNQEAIKIAIEVAKLLNAKIFDKMQFMRKIVIDGSNVSGFQRTALIAINGCLRTSKGKVSIQTVMLEEEAAKKINETKNSVTYRLDRLGVPLLEIATGPEIKDNWHAQETAALIGMILRSTGKAKRGIGSIRQDLNLSIKGRPRIELKGFQDLRSIPKVIENEISRLLKEKNIQSEVRRVNPDFTTSFLRPMPGSSRLYPETDIPVIDISDLIKKIKPSELLTEKIKKLEKQHNLPKELARELIENEYFGEFIQKYKNVNPSLIARILIEVPKEIKARFKLEKDIKKEDFEIVLGALNKNIISRDAILDVLHELSKGAKIDLLHYKSVPKNELENEIKEIIRKNKDASFNAVMGMVMQKFNGKVNGKEASEIIRKYKND